MRADHSYDDAPTMEWYYCSVHRVSHCIARVARNGRPVFRGCPIVGECAWLFFTPNEVELMATHDVHELNVEAADDRDGGPEDGTMSSLATLFNALALADDGSAASARTMSRPRRSRTLSYNFSPGIETMLSPPDIQDAHIVIENGSTDTGTDSESISDTSSDRNSSETAPSSIGEEDKGAAADGTKIIQVPIHRPLVDSNDRDEVLMITGAFVPPGADESVLQSIEQAGEASQRLIHDRDRDFHVEFFTYTDAFGMAAAQPIALDMDAVRRYFRPLDGLEKTIHGTCGRVEASFGCEATGRGAMAVDPALYRVREWSC